MVLQPCHSSLLPQCIGFWTWRKIGLGRGLVEAGYRQLVIFQSLTWPAHYLKSEIAMGLATVPLELRRWF